MEPAIKWGLIIAMVVLVGVFRLISPRIARRGLLFGVYVGEGEADGTAARWLKARWTRAILMWTAMSLACVWLLMPLWGPAATYLAAVGVLLIGYYIEYVRSYRKARALAGDAPAPPGVAYLSASPAPRPLLAYLSLACAVAAGLGALAHTWFHAAALPTSIPVDFNFAGEPNRFAPRSFASVWALPLTTLVQGVVFSLFAVLIARAKRAVRRDDGGVSLAAQERFRAAISNFLAVVALLTTGLLTALSVGSVRVAIGTATTLPSAGTVAGILLGVTCTVGALYLALRLGQGGARLERAASSAPLTNGLADNRRWVLGMFYVNPDDPSFFVEARFGFGYTVNFGNWRAVMVYTAFLLCVLGVAVGPHLVR